jgi:microcystin-dependent protein
MAQGFALASPRMRFFDANGLPLAGGHVWFYIAGSSTPQNTYSDSALSSANTNPVILSASGEATVFVPAATLYKVNLLDAANVQQSGWPVDGIEALPAAAQPDSTPSPVPPGGIVAYGGTSAPTGYLLCQGALVSRATYATLFAIVGTAFGAGDGATTFGLPDLRQRVPLGTAAAGTGSTLGGTGGTIDHLHTGPSHTHAATVTRDGWGLALNNPSIDGRLNVGAAAGVGQFGGSYQPAADLTVTSAAGGTGNTGTANPPFQSVNFIIKT